MDWYWAIELPEHFVVEHLVGTVLGRAEYGDYFCVYQGVTVGGNKGIYPRIGATILVVVSANTFIIDTDVPDCSVVFGNREGLTFKRYTEEEMMRRYFSGWK